MSKLNEYLAWAANKGTMTGRFSANRPTVSNTPKPYPPDSESTTFKVKGPPVGCYAWLVQTVTHMLASKVWDEFGTDVWPAGLHEPRDSHVKEAWDDFMKAPVKGDEVYVVVTSACVESIWLYAWAIGLFG